MFILKKFSSQNVKQRTNINNDYDIFSILVFVLLVPNIKYFKPASVEYSECRLKLAMI